MLRLRREPAAAVETLDLGAGASVSVRAATALDYHAAMAHADAIVNAIDDGVDALNLLGIAIPGVAGDLAARDGLRQWAFRVELASACLTAWQGVGDQDGVVLEKPTPETAKLLLADQVILSRVAMSALRSVHEVLAEGEGSAVSQTGAREAASTIAGPAATKASPAPSPAAAMTDAAAPSASTRP